MSGEITVTFAELLRSSVTLDFAVTLFTNTPFVKVLNHTVKFELAHSDRTPRYLKTLSSLTHTVLSVWLTYSNSLELKNSTTVTSPKSQSPVFLTVIMKYA